MQSRFEGRFFAVGSALILIVALVGAGCSGTQDPICGPDEGDRDVAGLLTSCAIVNGDFSQGFTGWQNESEGPGVSCGIQEIVDVDGRSDVLHLDSRACSNYYLFLTQTISGCGLIDGALSWDWKLVEIERSYGLAAVFVKFFNASSELMAAYFVRRDTGDFWQYDCPGFVSRMCAENPGIAFGCERIIGSAFAWDTHTVTFTRDFFDNLGCVPVNPDEIHSIQVWIESYNNAGAGVDAYFDNFAFTEGTARVEAALDIKPGSCPNPLNPKSKGKLPAAILGTADFDVDEIDVSSLLLEGVAPIRSAIEDVSTPVRGGGDACDCSVAGPDGYPDLTLKFETQAVVEALGPVHRGDVRVLTMTGALRDGTPFEAADCVVVVGGHGEGGGDEWIVFARDRDVWRARPDGSLVERIADLPAGAEPMGVVVSPDASLVAYMEYFSEFSPSNRLVLMNIDGSNSRTVVMTGGNGTSAAQDFHPDGVHIMYSRDVAPGSAQNYELFEVSLDGSSDVNLTNHPNNEGGGSYSPTGDMIAFTSGAPFCSACGDVYTQHHDGTGRVEVFDLAGDADGATRWSPDGARILISSRFPGDQEDMYLIDPDGSNPFRITYTAGIRERNKAWSPDGSRIVFERSGNLYFISPDGTGEVLFLETATWPDWAGGRRTVALGRAFEFGESNF